MRPQGFGGQVGGGLEDLGWDDMGFEPPKPAATPEPDAEHDAFGEELTPHPLRNPLAALTPVGSPVHDQQAEIADRLDVADEVEDERSTRIMTRPPSWSKAMSCLKRCLCPSRSRNRHRSRSASRTASLKPRSQPEPNGKAAFTLRLDPSRHLKLRLACAVNGRSAQQLVTDAVDRLLADMPELDSMAERLLRQRAKA